MAKVSICMAVYRPDERYFLEQLKSIDAQTYPDLELLILEDCGGNGEEIRRLVEATVKKVPVVFQSNDRNLGSNETFARLTERARGEYLAFCDQDDVWEPEKIASLVALMEEGVTLAYSDLSVIDGEGRLLYASFQQKRRRVRHLSGNGLYPFFIRRNCVTGCTMLVQSQVAKRALPLPGAYVHDHWLALRAAVEGRIAYCPRPLVRYRLHGHNQIGANTLSDAHDRNDYLSVRLSQEQEKYDAVYEAYPEPEIRQTVEQYNLFLARRRNYLKKRTLKAFFSFCKGFRTDPALFLLEFALAALPLSWGRAMLKKIKK